MSAENGVHLDPVFADLATRHKNISPLRNVSMYCLRSRVKSGSLLGGMLLLDLFPKGSATLSDDTSP